MTNYYDRWFVTVAALLCVAMVSHVRTKELYEPEIARLNDQVKLLQIEKQRTQAQLEGALMIRR